MSKIGYSYLGNIVALEDIPNRSICVKESTGIRKINGEIDLYNAELVFVNNINPEETIIDVIKSGGMVRYKKVNVIL